VEALGSDLINQPICKNLNILSKNKQVTGNSGTKNKRWEFFHMPQLSNEQSYLNYYSKQQDQSPVLALSRKV